MSVRLLTDSNNLAPAESVLYTIPENLLHSHDFDWLSSLLGCLALAIALATLWAVRNQIKIAQQQLRTSQEQLTTGLAGLTQSINASRHISRDQRRVATLDFILKLETDREHLLARKLFAEVRDRGEDTGYTFEVLVTGYLESKREGSLAENEKLEKDYQRFISYMNVMELTSVGIQAGTLDEDALKSWHRRAYVRNVTAAMPAILVMQKGANAAVFKEALELARAWASGEDEKNRLDEMACEAAKNKLSLTLAELQSYDKY